MTFLALLAASKEDSSLLFSFGVTSGEKGKEEGKMYINSPLPILRVLCIVEVGKQNRLNLKLAINIQYSVFLQGRGTSPSTNQLGVMSTH